MTISEARANVGLHVVYRAGSGTPEDGTIVRVSDAGWVFVRFGQYDVRATAASDLTLSLADALRASLDAAIGNKP